MKKVEKKTSIRLGSFAIYATLALIVAKVAGLITISWLMVFTPIWLWLASFIGIMAVLAVIFIAILLVGWLQKITAEKVRELENTDKREM